MFLNVSEGGRRSNKRRAHLEATEIRGLDALVEYLLDTGHTQLRRGAVRIGLGSPMPDHGALHFCSEPFIGLVGRR